MSFFTKIILEGVRIKLAIVLSCISMQNINNAQDLKQVLCMQRLARELTSVKRWLQQGPHKRPWHERPTTTVSQVIPHHKCE